MDQQQISFLTKEDLTNLENYEYHGGEYTFVDNILNPFWYKVAYAFPAWFAPNLITLTGLIVNISAAMLVLLYDPFLLGNAPGWVYINAAICLQVYAVLDAADGKQARRLSASSPLGQIFDHGCDAVNLLFIIICSCSAAGFGIGQLTALTLSILYSVFVCAQLVEYQSNILLAGSKFFGVTETMILVSAFLLLTGLKGSKAWAIDVVPYLPFLERFVSSLQIPRFLDVCLLTLVGSICSFYLLVYFVRACPIPMEKRGNKNVDRLSYLSRLIPASTISGCTYVMLTSSLTAEHPIYLLLLCGLTYSFLSIRVNLAHLCRRRLGYYFSPMYPLIVLTLNHIFGLINESAMLFGCFGFFMIYYVVFVFVTVDQIKRRLGIRVFHVPKKIECIVCWQKASGGFECYGVQCFDCFQKNSEKACRIRNTCKREY